MPPADVYELTVPKAAGGEPLEVVVGFEGGLPVSLDGRPLALHELVPALDALVGPYGFGRIDMIENRRVGIKSREIYECPGALALLMAHADLEAMTLERDVAHEKSRLEPRWAELVYDGLWYSPLKTALDAFFAETQRHRDRGGPPALRAGGRPGRRRQLLRRRADGARSACTTTTWPPIQRRTASGTRTPKVSCAFSASASRPGPASRGRAKPQRALRSRPAGVPSRGAAR